ncbi:MAG: hypothetical protein ACOC2U_04755 [bacterium]
MNNYLKSAAKRYEEKLGKEFLINPISNIDGEIITEITELLKKLKANEAVEVLKSYKYKKDEEIRDELLGLNTNFKSKSVKVDEDSSEDEIEGVAEEKSKTIYFSDFQQTFIKKFQVLGGRKMIFVDKETRAEFPAILLNEVDELATKEPMYANTILTYEEEVQRDEDYENLISEMK